MVYDAAEKSWQASHIAHFGILAESSSQGHQEWCLYLLVHSAASDSLNTRTKSHQKSIAGSLEQYWTRLLINLFWHVGIVELQPRIRDLGPRIQQKAWSYLTLRPFKCLGQWSCFATSHTRRALVAPESKGIFESSASRRTAAQGLVQQCNEHLFPERAASLSVCSTGHAAFHLDAASVCASAVQLLLRCTGLEVAWLRDSSLFCATLQNRHICCPDSRFCIFSWRP